MKLYFWFLIAFAGNCPTDDFPNNMVRDFSSLGPQHFRKIEHQQLKKYTMRLLIVGKDLITTQ